MKSGPIGRRSDGEEACTSRGADWGGGLTKFGIFPRCITGVPHRCAQYQGDVRISYALIFICNILSLNRIILTLIRNVLALNHNILTLNRIIRILNRNILILIQKAPVHLTPVMSSSESTFRIIIIGKNSNKGKCFIAIPNSV